MNQSVYKTKYYERERERETYACIFKRISLPILQMTVKFIDLIFTLNGL